MKRWVSFSALLVAYLVAGQFIGRVSADLPPLRVTSLDGSYSAPATRWLKFPNGTVSGSGGVVTYTPAALPAIVNTVAGTANQVLVNGGTAAQSGAVTLTLPQSIGTASTPTFGSLTLNGSALVANLTISSTGGNGPGVLFQDNSGGGGGTPNKYLRALLGQLQLVNSAYSAVVAVVTDTGAIGAGVDPQAQIHALSSSAAKSAAIFSSAASPTANIVEVQINGTFKSGFDSAARLRYDSALTGTTVGAAGAAAALPALPLGYLLVNVNGSQVKVPYYNN